MEDEKVPELEIEQSEVEPIEIDPRLRPASKQQDFGKDPKTLKSAPGIAEEGATVAEENNDSGKFPRATKRRSHKEEVKTQKEQRQKVHKMVQEMMQPIRRRDFPGIVNQIMSMLQHRFERIEKRLDQLMLMPDYITTCMSTHPAGSGELAVKPSTEGFMEFIEEYEKKLEEEAKEMEEKLKAEAEAKAKEESPQTEEKSGS